MKTFELLNPVTGEIEATYKNEQPRQAAMKAANGKHTDILLRESDSAGDGYVARIHRFKGSVAPAQKFLPIGLPWLLAKIEKESGKKVPPEFNIAGKETEFVKAGFKAPNKPNVKKVSTMRVSKIEGADMYTCIKEFMKTLPKGI